MKKRMESIIDEALLLLLFFLIIMSCVLFGCRVTQVHEVDGSAEAKVITEFPLAERCFDDSRVTTWEELKECLELTTNMRYTVDVDGELTELPAGIPIIGSTGE